MENGEKLAPEVQARLLDVVMRLICGSDIEALMRIPEKEWKGEDAVGAFVFASGVLQRGMRTMAECGALGDLITGDPWLQWMKSVGEPDLRVVISEANRMLRRRAEAQVERDRAALASAEAKLAALGAAAVAP